MRLGLFLCCAPLLLGLASCSSQPRESKGDAPDAAPPHRELAQTPSWSKKDMDFFLHGSMSTEVVPEDVFRAFILSYPDLFPGLDLSPLGLIADPAFGWPVGFSRSQVKHLGDLPSVGINCAACHVAEITPAGGGTPVRVLGVTSPFNAEAFFGGIIVSTFRTEDPDNMKKFLGMYLAVKDPAPDQKLLDSFSEQWGRQEDKIKAAIAKDPTGATNLPAGTLQSLAASELALNGGTLTNTDLAALSHSMLKLFHNMRASLLVPDQAPDKAPPASGPGRNDAFGVLSATLFNSPQPFAPVKFGLVWDVNRRHWVHWDGNTQSPLARNLLASLGLGAPLIGKRGELDFALVQRQTELSERIRPPRYPFVIDAALARRGAAHYQARCASCHDGAESDARLHSAKETGTDPVRAELFTQIQADKFDKFLAELEIPGYTPSREPGIRSTQKYWAASMPGVWARSPYLHNGSVRTMQELLASPGSRAKTFHRGSRTYDAEQMGYTDDGAYVFDTASSGNANTGHDYGTDLTSAQKRELIEYLKTL